MDKLGLTSTFRLSIASTAYCHRRRRRWESWNFSGMGDMVGDGPNSGPLAIGEFEPYLTPHRRSQACHGGTHEK